MGVASPTRRNGTPGGSALTRPLVVRVGYALGITSPRRAALLAVVVCVLVLSVAVPLRNYVAQRAQLATVYEQQQVLADKVAELERRRGLLSDPQQVETQARERLRYVHPGETPYLVQLPPGPPVAASRVQAPKQPWYHGLWKSINSA